MVSGFASSPAFGLSRRTLLGALALLAAPAFSPAWAQDRARMGAAINRVARYRAQSQRLAKAYGLLLLGVESARPQALLHKVQDEVQAGFAALGVQNWPQEVQALLTDIRTQSDGLLALIARAPSKDNLLAVSAQSDRMLLAANAAADALEALAQVPTAKLVNTAGRVRWMTQRLAKNYVLLAAGAQDKAVREQMPVSARELEMQLEALEKAPLSTPAIRSALELARGQWLFFSSALKRAPDARGLADVASTSERLLELADGLTNAYDAALREVLGL